MIYNESSATWNNSTSVDIYLSTNDFISTFDTFLGTLTVSNSIGPNGRLRVTANNSITIPSDVSGTFYIGGIITSSDSDTSNNTTVADDVCEIVVVSNAPQNDDWNDTFSIVDPDFSVTGSNVNATVEPDEQQLTNTGSTVWWFFDADTDGTITVDTFGSSYDTQLHVYEFPTSGQFADLVPVVNNDDAPSCLLYTSPSPRDQRGSRMPSSA